MPSPSMDYRSVGSSGRKRVAEKKEQQYRKGEQEEIEAMTESLSTGCSSSGDWSTGPNSTDGWRMGSTDTSALPRISLC